MKKLILIGLLLFNMTSVFASDDCRGEFQHNVLIHGIGGSETSFGVMDEVLEKYIPCSKSHYFVYDTKDSRLTILDFAKRLAVFLQGIGKTQDKDLNLIMHSQGGLVGLTYLYNSYKELKGFDATNLPRINNFISLSTPFWGSDFALIGKFFFFGLNFKKNFLSPFGKAQLRDMKYGSKFLEDQTSYLFSQDNRTFLNFLAREINVLNISGMGPYSRSYLKRIGSQFFEGDLVVNIPSMTINTLNASANSLDYSEGVTQFLETIPSSPAQQAYVIGTHMNVYYGTIGYGIVDIPKSCLDLANCKHPGFNTLYDFLTTGEVRTNTSIERMIKGFELHISVDFPKEISDLKDARIVIMKKKKKDVSLSHYRFKKKKQRAIRINNKEKRGHYLIKGSLRSQSPTTSIELEIRHPEIVTRRVVLQVEKGKATFLKIKVKAN